MTIKTLIPPTPTQPDRIADEDSMVDTLPHAIQKRLETKLVSTEAELIEGARKRLEIMIKNPEWAIEQLKQNEESPENAIALSVLVKVWAATHDQTLIEDPLVVKALEEQATESRENRFVRAWHALFQSGSEAERELRQRVLALSHEKDILRSELTKKTEETEKPLATLQQEILNAQESLAELRKTIEAEKLRRETLLQGDVEIESRPEFRAADERLKDITTTLRGVIKTFKRPGNSPYNGLRPLADTLLIFKTQIHDLLRDVDWKFGSTVRAKIAIRLFEKHGLALSELVFVVDEDRMENCFGGDNLKTYLQAAADPQLKHEDVDLAFQRLIGPILNPPLATLFEKIGLPTAESYKLTMALELASKNNSELKKKLLGE